jgi:hypothetical protein
MLPELGGECRYRRTMCRVILYMLCRHYDSVAIIGGLFTVDQPPADLTY